MTSTNPWGSGDGGLIFKITLYYLKFSIFNNNTTYHKERGESMAYTQEEKINRSMFVRLTRQKSITVILSSLNN